MAQRFSHRRCHSERVHRKVSAKIAKALSIPEVGESDNDLERTFFAVDMSHGTDVTPGSPKDVKVVCANDIVKDRVTSCNVSVGQR